MDNENLKLEDLLQDSTQHDNNAQFEYVAIIGAGIMGQGIAQTIAAAGIETIKYAPKKQNWISNYRKR